MVIGIIGLLLAILLPALERAREQANTLRCAANLNQIGVALVTYQLRMQITPAFVLAADMNPGIAGKNSRNHEWRGQNVLFADYHVEWKSTPACGVSGDDIYTNKTGEMEASPVDAGDSVPLPIDR
ncbi:MAG: hypothetical protein ABSH20_25520 [Tepidisphaeraceae bacterium]